MAITITITHESSTEMLQELRALFGGLNAAGIPAASDFGLTLAPDTANTFYPEDVAAQSPTEDKPKRHRRTKAEIEAERAEPEPEAEVIEADEDQAYTATRADVTDRMTKIIQQRLLTPAELKQIFADHAGGATNAASMDEKFAGAVLVAFENALQK